MEPRKLLKRAKELVQKLQDEIAKLHEENVKFAVFDGASYAAKNLPRPNDPSAEPYLTGIKNRYVVLKNRVGVTLQAGLQKMLGLANINRLNEKLKSLEELIKQEKDRRKNLGVDLSRLNIPGIASSYKKQNWKLYLFGCADALYIMSAFLKFGDVLLISALIGSILGLAQVFSVKTITLAIREITDPRKQRRAIIMGVAAFTVISLVFGMVRYYFAHLAGATNVPFIFLNPITFAVFNMILVMASACTVYFYFPSKSDQKVLDRIDDLKEEINKSQAVEKQLIQQKDQVEIQRVEALEVHGQFVHDQDMLSKQIEAYYGTAFGSFVTENTAKRTDNAFPECFKGGPGPLPPADDSFPLTSK